MKSIAGGPGAAGHHGRSVFEDPSLPPPVRAAHDLISATFIGHSTFLLQIGGVCVLTDPIWSDVVVLSKSQVRDEHGGPGQSLNSLPGVDLLLVSHNHYGHMDWGGVRARWAPGAVTGLGDGRHL